MSPCQSWLRLRIQSLAKLATQRRRAKRCRRRELRSGFLGLMVVVSSNGKGKIVGGAMVDSGVIYKFTIGRELW